MKIPRIVIAGTTSGVGKTSITCAIIFGLQKKGYTVQPFKVGPDYIDPSYLSTISNKDTYNLDVWLMGKQQLLESFLTHSQSDISVIEGVMGFYDGFDGDSNFASTHHVASLTKSPVILVLDASKTSRSIAATVKGFQKFHRNSHIVGIILNKIGSKKHENLCRKSLENSKLPIIGVIPKNPKIIFKSRHLGLIPSIMEKSLEKNIKINSKIILEYIDIEAVIKLAKNSITLQKPKPIQSQKPKTKIGIALDNSFNFYYHDNLNALRRDGAKLSFFSPISTKKLPQLDGIYIGGGFPEILASSLTKNQTIQQKIKKLAEDNLPIYAECGGLMYLTKSIEHEQKKFKMTGLFDAETQMTKKMKLNYTKGRIISNCSISKNPKNFQGHEFHYSQLTSVSSDSKFVYDLSIGDGIKNHKDGLIEYNVLASYGHLYFDSSNFSKQFIQNCVNTSRH